MMLPNDDVTKFLARAVPEPVRTADAFGTRTRQFARLGRHWKFEVFLRKIPTERLAQWEALERRDAVLSWPIAQSTLTGAGTPRVQGAGQGGSTLVTDGWPAGFVIPSRRYLSIVSGGRRYVVRTTAPVTASGAGAASLPVFPILRFVPADNAVIEINAIIDGLIEFEGFEESQGFAAPSRFTITEEE